MKYEWQQKGNMTIISAVKDFELEDIFECGQCFRWNKEKDGSYTGVAFSRMINVSKAGEDVVLRGTTKEDFENIWIKYFDLSTDYGKIKKRLSIKDPIMKKATDFGGGIRILKQEPWETLASFIISANNNIPRIKKIIDILSTRYGKEIGNLYDVKYYSFPTVNAIISLTNEELVACNMGYRGKYLLETAMRVYENPKILQALYGEDTMNCIKKLMEFSGVGPKVANCIAFFAYSKLDAFPVDVWIKRLVEDFYFQKKEMSPKEIENFGYHQYGAYAGYAQQYLFYYGRERAIGKGD